MGAEDGEAAGTAAGEFVVLLSTQEAFRRWSACYDAAPNPILSLMDRNLGEIPAGRMIDVACGTGRRVASTGGIGVDLSREMLANRTGRAAQADARMLPFADGIADVVVCTLALSYISPVGQVMREMRRIARAGGLIIAADLHPAAIAAGWTRSFRQGDAVYEIETYPYAMEDLEVEGLALEDARDLSFGEPERALYTQAGKAALFETVRATPAVWIRRWRR